MHHNVGGTDRSARMAAGLGLLAYATLGNAERRWQPLLLGASAVALLTAVSRYCPMNATLGIDTGHGGAETGHGGGETGHGGAETGHGRADARHGFTDTWHDRADTWHGRADTWHERAAR
jgi:hypothetical protein